VLLVTAAVANSCPEILGTWEFSPEDSTTKITSSGPNREKLWEPFSHSKQIYAGVLEESQTTFHNFGPLGKKS
jgi:hypothetical protein